MEEEQDLHGLLKEHFGYTAFRPMQEEVVRHTLGGGDSLVLMPTGGGKSLCYQLAALAMPGMAVVVSPLISLMKDQVEGARANGIAAEALNSAADVGEGREVMVRCTEGRVKLLYLSPERLMAYMGGFLRYLPVSLFAIDEAHCISAWGHDFRPEYTQLGQLRDLFPRVPVMALTATADKLTRQDIVEQLRIPQARLFVGSFDRPNLSLDVRRGYAERDRLRFLKELLRRHAGESGIVYCLSRKTSEKVAARLAEEGFSVGVYHAGMDSTERSRVQDDFANDRLQVVCATIAFGMGIDKSNVRFVVHFNMPKSIENYYQEIGRGGRDGMPCETVLFYNLQDLITLRRFAEGSAQRGVNLDKLQRMQEYADARVCRRRILLNYFGELRDCACGNCDNCQSPQETYDGTVAVQKALSAIVRSGEQAPVTTVIDILKGTVSQEVVEHGYQNLKTFGAGADTPARVWRDVLLQMLQLGFVEIVYNEGHRLTVTPLGTDVLYGRRAATLARMRAEERRGGKRREADAEAVMPLTVEEQLLARLRALRQRIAVEVGTAPHFVVGDPALHEMAMAMPSNLDAFGSIGGVGRHRVEAYGQRFVDEICAFMTENGIPIPPPLPAPHQHDRGEESGAEKPRAEKVRAPRNYLTVGGVRYDVPLDLWERFDWRGTLRAINEEAYWNYGGERDLPLAAYVAAEQEERARVVELLARILSEAYGLLVDKDLETVHLPQKHDYDSDGNEVLAPGGTFEKNMASFRRFVDANGRYPMLDGEHDEAVLRKWFREVGHGIVPLDDAQKEAFAKMNEDYAAVPKTRAQLLKNNQEE